mmetsp:Transcript_3028/g.8520  ORF Transcript_3028/g.8520 Transcript_3028/m.8520 type:complete len:410 (+) Transcript_3028:3-1232(+)
MLSHKKIQKQGNDDWIHCRNPDDLSTMASTSIPVGEEESPLGNSFLVGRELQQRDDGSGSDEQQPFFQSRFNIILCAVLFMLAVTGVFCMVVREHFRRQREHRQRESSAQLERDHELAQELQHALNNEVREQEKRRKCKERQNWYEVYLKPYTMVVRESDFVQSNTDEAQIPESPTRKTVDVLRLESFTTTESKWSERGVEKFADDGVESDLESSNTIAREQQQQDDNDSDDDSSSLTSNIYIRLPCQHMRIDGIASTRTTSVHDHFRTVDAHCAICLGGYRAGDKVSWSGLECQHAFHFDCILPWLGKGKKRCPICRNWFVPGTKIDDQKKAAEAATAAVVAEDDVDIAPTSETSEVIDQMSDEDIDSTAHEHIRGISPNLDAESPSSAPFPSQRTPLEGIRGDDEQV